MSEHWKRLRERIESGPYERELGVLVKELGEGHATIRLPYDDKNSNPGQALHGGVAASMIDITGAAAACTLVEDPGLETGVVDLTVDYLSAAIAEEIVATARVLRKGKELTYVEVDVTKGEGKPVAKGLVTHRAAPGRDEPRTFGDPPDAGAVSPGEVSKFGKMFMMVPFIHRLGMQNERMENGTGRIRLPWSDANAGGDGNVHEGALAALVDTTGAVASWSITGPDPSYKASTVGVHVSFMEPARGEDLIALSRTLRRREELFFNQVTVVGATSGHLVAHGDVLYRIVVP